MCVCAFVCWRSVRWLGASRLSPNLVQFPFWIATVVVSSPSFRRSVFALFPVPSPVRRCSSGGGELDFFWSDRCLVLLPNDDSIAHAVLVKAQSHSHSHSRTRTHVYVYIHTLYAHRLSTIMGNAAPSIPTAPHRMRRARRMGQSLESRIRTRVPCLRHTNPLS